MGQYKIWASKNVGILEDYPTINTGENEVAELWYGEYGLSRFLLKFDFSDYLAEYTAGRVPHFSASTFTDAALNIKNCSPIFEDYDLSLSTQRATSAEIILNKVDTAWDEGIGHDYISTDKEAGFACWSSAQTLTQWSTAGGDYSTEIMRVALDNGSENFSGSVSGTDMLWSTVTGTNNGYMLKFTDAFEALSGAYKTITKFYTRHTNTVHQPHITITWDNQITDERDDVYPGVSKRLYLYTKKDGTFENVNDISGVTISGVNHSGFVASDINNPLPGIYYIDFICPATAATDTVITDTWFVQYESGIYTGIQQTATVLGSSSAWETDSSVDPSEYWITTPDLQETYMQASKIYLDIIFRVPYYNTAVVVKTAEYRIMIKDNFDKVEYTTWEGISYTDQGNFIYIDTSWFQPDFMYNIEFKYEIDGNVIYNKDWNKRFKVVQ